MILFKPKLNLFARKPEDELGVSSSKPSVSLAKAESSGNASYSETPQEMINFYNNANARYSSPTWGKSNSYGQTYAQFLNTPQYKALENQYVYNGQRAMDDTIGKVAARTGGLASSYAGTAGQSSYNDYMTKLSDAAYAMYRGEQDDARQQALYNLQLEQNAYQKDQDALKFGYQKEQDALAQANKERQWDIDAAERERAYGLQDRDDARDQALMYLQMGGKVAGLDPALIEQSGYSKDYLEQAAKYYALQNQPKYTGGGGGSKTQKVEEPKYTSLPTTWGEFRNMTGMSPAEQTAFVTRNNLKGQSPEDAFYAWNQSNTPRTVSELYKQYQNSNAAPSVNLDSDVLKTIDGREGASAKLAVINNKASNNAEFMAYAEAAGISTDEVQEWLASKGYR